MSKENELLVSLEEAGLEVLRCTATVIFVDFGCAQMIVNASSQAQIFCDLHALKWPTDNTISTFNGDESLLFNDVELKIYTTKYVTLEAAIPIIKRMLS